MKPVTSQDMKWTRLQMIQGPKHQHVKLRGLGCLPTRSTQPERYSRNPGQHDLPVQIQRFKCPLMAKVWLRELWASTIPSIWICGRPNSDKGARIYDPRNPCCVVSPKSEQIIFQGRFGDLIFIYKERNEYQSWRKFRAIQPGHRICIIWSLDVGDMVRQGRATNQENLDESDFMETKFPSLPRKISCKTRWRTPQVSPRA
jgi:hypothetical protein